MAYLGKDAVPLSIYVPFGLVNSKKKKRKKDAVPRAPLPPWWLSRARGELFFLEFTRPKGT